jgi:phosphoglycerate dehydrogenase-like enzyme
MRRVAILNDYQGVARDYADWTAIDDRVETRQFRDHIADTAALIQALQPFDVIVAMRERTALSREVITQLPNLELVVTTGPYNAAIDGDALRERGIVYCGTGGALHNTAELTWALILACARQVPREDRNVKGGGWMLTVGSDLFGHTLGLCGLGRLGGLVANVGKAFGMNLIAWSQNLTADRCAEVGATLVAKEELFAQADFLSIHLVLSDRTRGLVGDSELRLMKPTAYLVNSSRGPIVDEDALAEVLRERVIAGAGLDTFGVEPLPDDHPFRRLDNLVVTPHLGYVTDGCYRIFFHDIVEDIAAWLDGNPIRVVAG